MTKFDQIQESFRKIDPFYLSSKRYDPHTYDRFSFSFILTLNHCDTLFSIRLKLKHLLIKGKKENTWGFPKAHLDSIVALLENDLRIDNLILTIKEILAAPEEA